jgi:hypothetical protein
MKRREQLLTDIYVPTDIGAASLVNNYDPEYCLGAIYAPISKRFKPVMSEDEGVGNREAVTAEVMQQVVDDVIWCPWRLERDGFEKQEQPFTERYYFRDVVSVHQYGFAQYGNRVFKGVRTYTDLIELVRLVDYQ